MVSIFPVGHFRYLLRATFGRSGICLCPVSAVAACLDSSKMADSRVSRRRMYSEFTPGNSASLMYAPSTGVRRLFIKSYLLPFPAEVHYTLQRRKENEIRGDQPYLCSPLLWHHLPRCRDFHLSRSHFSLNTV